MSVNQRVYGNLHNVGHDAISNCHDPDFRFLEEFGVMGDVTTAMRDPVFYRWHAYLDSILNRFKESLDPYSFDELKFNDIAINHLEVNIASAPPNIWLTFWEKSDVDLGAGLDFGPNGNIYALFTHLQHAPFHYNLQINNNSGAMKRGTCRIFLCPQKNERNNNLMMNEMRQLAVEMDKFVVTCKLAHLILPKYLVMITLNFSKSWNEHNKTIFTKFQRYNPI